MLKTILSVAGKPGLFKIVSNGKNMIIVESLVDRKKMPIHARDKVVSLGDISIYTISDEKPLQDVFLAMKKIEDGTRSSIEPNAKVEDLKEYFEKVLPDYDKEKVYPADIKKMITWYNLIIQSNIDFEEEEKTN